MKILRPTQEGDDDHCPIDAVITLIPTVTKQYFKAVPGAGIADTDQHIAQATTVLFAGFGARRGKNRKGEAQS